MHFPPWTAPMDTAFRFRDWTIRMEKADGYWRVEATKWLNSDWATGQSPEDAIKSLANKMGWDAGDLEVAWMRTS